ncbi:hypothetical protein [Candidatus Binatus soli]|uniref:hypothetical protein n=1 Tax=Candidatus Binatus soli TaxID=1953413 RepID=UPI003D0B1DDF
MPPNPIELIESILLGRVIQGHGPEYYRLALEFGGDIDNAIQVPRIVALVVVLNCRERGEGVPSSVVQNTENILCVSYPRAPGVGLVRVFIGSPPD